MSTWQQMVFTGPGNHLLLLSSKLILELTVIPHERVTQALIAYFGRIVVSVSLVSFAHSLLIFKVVR